MPDLSTAVLLEMLRVVGEASRRRGRVAGRGPVPSPALPRPGGSRAGRRARAAPRGRALAPVAAERAPRRRRSTSRRGPPWIPAAARSSTWTSPATWHRRAPTRRGRPTHRGPNSRTLVSQVWCDLTMCWADHRGDASSRRYVVVDPGSWRALNAWTRRSTTWNGFPTMAIAELLDGRQTPERTAQRGSMCSAISSSTCCRSSVDSTARSGSSRTARGRPARRVGVGSEAKSGEAEPPAHHTLFRKDGRP